MEESNNINVYQITKMASNLLQLGPEEQRGDFGVNEEIVAFVKNITLHPETSLDFPLPENEDDQYLRRSYKVIYFVC